MKPSSAGVVGVGLIAALVAWGCSGQDTTCVVNSTGELSCAEGAGVSGVESASFAERLAALSMDLQLGDGGPEVATVQEFLGRYGYLPNAHLSVEYPRWSPVLNYSPVPGVYDEVTAEAVGALQRQHGLEATHVVDEPTRALLRSPRCGVPDGSRNPDDLTRKYARDAAFSGWPGGTVTYDVINTDDGLQLTALRTAAANMMAVWAAESMLTITRDSAAPQITISFQALTNPNGTPDGVGNALGRTGGGGFGILLRLDTAETWTLGTPTGGARAVTPVLLHEIGHALGLDHSSFLGATMIGSLPNAASTDVTLEQDDQLAISTVYDTYPQINGVANDIGVASISGDAWIISKTPAGGGNFTIQKLMPDLFGLKVFKTTNDGSAVRISVAPNGRPWVVGADGTIWRRTTLAHDTGTWELIPGPEASGSNPGCARDIAVNSAAAEGVVWAIGCLAVSGGSPIYKRVGSTFVRTNNGGAERIAVSNGGVPWVVAANGSIHYRSTGTGTPPAFSSDHLAPSTWTQTTNGLALDIGVFNNNYPWVVGVNNGVHVWNRQSGGVAGNPPDPARDTWLPMNVAGQAVAIAVGPNNMPWIVASDGKVRKPLK